MGISNSLQTLDFPVQTRPVLGEINSQNENTPADIPVEKPVNRKDHSDLLEKLRQKSLDIHKRTSHWEEQIKIMTEKRDQKIMQNPPGVENMEHVCQTNAPVEPIIPPQA